MVYSEGRSTGGNNQLQKNIMKIFNVYVKNHQKKKRDAIVRKIEASVLFVVGTFAGASFYTII